MATTDPNQPRQVPATNALPLPSTRPRQGSSATEKFYYPAPRRRRGNSTASTVMTSTNASLHSHSNANIPLSYAPSLHSQASTSSQALPHAGQRPFPLTPPRRRKKTITEPPVVLNNVVHNMTSLERLRMMTHSLNSAAGSDFVPPPPPSSSGSTYSTAPSTRSGGGYGQQFAVASVGSNGMMYLRPVTRQIQDPFVTGPATPPKTADQKQSLSELREAPEEGRESPPPRLPEVQVTSTTVPPLPIAAAEASSIHTPKTPKTASPPESPKWQAPLKAPPSSPPIPKVTQHRARSLSIVGDHAKPASDKPDGLPSRPVTEKFEHPPRPRTAGPSDAPIHLDVPIPRGTLGSPEFSPSGTPFILGSSLAPQSNLTNLTTEGRKTGSWGNMYPELKLPWLSATDRKKPPPTASGISSAITTALPSPALHASEPIMAGGVQNIKPSIFNNLSFPPLCDDPSIVRYDPRTRDITAATAPRIIAQITSAAFLDYQFMSDFFLTFRAFMTPHDLVLYLMARLKWAIDRGDEIGKVVRVRTFVAIRHWLLNYYADDYVPSLELREKFVQMLNDLSDDVFARLGSDKSNMNIIAELKKCWRKAAVLYWDGIPGGINDHEVKIHSHITPGGEAGTRDDPRSLKAAFEEDWSRRKGKGRARDSKSSIRRLPSRSAFATGATQRLIRDIINAGPSSSRQPKRPTLARAQDSTRALQSKPKPRPVSDSSSLHAYNGGQSSVAPLDGPSSPSSPPRWKPLLHTGKRTHSSHKRSGSYNEPSRSNWTPPRSSQFLQGYPSYTSPYLNAGDLVRGNLKPPTTAVVELMAPATPNEKSPTELKMQNGKLVKHRGALSGPSVKRLFVNVKRAFSGRAAIHHDKPTPPVPTHRRGPSEALAKYVVEKGKNVTLTGILSRTESLASESPSALARIDLLGAGVVEAFHNALQEEIRITTLTPLGRVSGDANASKHTLTIGKALTTMQETPSPKESKGKGRATEETVRSWESEEAGYDGGLTPTAKGFFTRSKTSTSSTENGKKELKKKDIKGKGKAVDEDWNNNNNGVVTPSPSNSSEIRRSKSLSYMTLGKEPRSFQPSHGHQASLDSYDSSATGKYIPKNFSRGGLRSTISSQIPEDENIEEDSIFGSPSSKSIGSPFRRPPGRMLRRKPGGGDLKAAESIGNLGSHARQQSEATVETIGTFSDSTMSIWQKHPETEMYSQPNVMHGVLSLGAMTMVKPAPKPSSPDHFEDDEEDDDDESGEDDGDYDDEDDSGEDDDEEGSEVVRENTFEAGVLKLANMSDTMSDDGGVEVALAKLEGTYNRKQLARALSIHREREAAERAALEQGQASASAAPQIQVHEQEVSESESESESELESARPSTLAPLEKRKQRQRQIIDNDTFTPLPSSGVNGLTIDERITSGFPFEIEPRTQSFLLPESEMGEDDDDKTEKENIPIATRILSADTNLLSVPDTIDEQRTLSLSEIERELRGAPGPSEPKIAISEVELDPDDMSDMSSEISEEPLPPKRPRRPISISSSVLPGLQPSAILAEAGVPAHPMRHPPSPPLTVDRAISKSPELPTVDMSTIIAPETKADPLSRQYPAPTKLRKAIESGVHATAIHLPFILAYDSELLAKQFTLIEKDALTEIDWKELVELRWKPTSKPFRDWVDFLKNNDVRGVEIVVARFNLMVSWATSEIVMTRDIYERARCITKYIHIAAHARRLQNFATTYQLVIALLSYDVARLKKTWSLVTEADRATFRDLESLVQPNMNYHNLRKEMDLVTGETGCIPFVGLFTHDLIHTATMTSQVAGTPHGPALVNWAKYKRTAEIVKKLLRLVDASAKYNFEPVDGVCERCLWMATLTKDEISSLSLDIEPPSDYR
ncbi:hypothetical protein Dda_8791 [Drechslerella dactyloides]|uniref:Guanine nucleotide exchange factor LTE1 n=1 Tax=Drechslerella dactyloides TaxID=74499 RepID=A0AAD6IR29_DREDA|nr:hypothetical protein Dda_8791 [Drechslerella dactyloides]